MHVVVLGNDILKKELLAQSQNSDLEITWITDVQQLTINTPGDIHIDLLFESTPERIQLLQRLGKPILVNSVSQALSAIDFTFIRINGWAGFLHTSIVEASGTDEHAKATAEEVFQALGKRIIWVPDQVGFVTPRVVSAIINEAYFALEEGVSTKEEINTAMKLGTNYPFGPFEWAALIGLKKIVDLLQVLSMEQPRYQPAPLLVSEATM